MMARLSKSKLATVQAVEEYFVKLSYLEVEELGEWTESEGT